MHTVMTWLCQQGEHAHKLIIYVQPRLAECVQDSATAKSLAFNREVRTRCVTLEGDDFNPSGTLTGAPRPLLSTRTPSCSFYKSLTIPCLCLKQI